MFSFNKKVDPNLKYVLKFNDKRSYRVLIKVKNFQDSISRKITSYKGTIIRQIESCHIICAIINSKGIERLLEYPEIEFICLDKYFTLCGMSVQTGNKIRFTNKTGVSGKGVGVGIIDSGVYPHKDLTLPYNRISTFVDLVNGLSYPYDDNGHGTSVCGVIGGNGHSSNNMYRGIAPQCDLHCYKAFDKLGKGFVSDILFALESLINIAPKYNIKVLCLPFETLYFDNFVYSEFNTLLAKAVKQSIIPILPSGSNKNDDSSILGISLSKNCLTISGLNTTSGIQSYTYSSSGCSKKDSKPDFCAACVDIVSLNSNTSYISQRDSIKVHAPKLDTSYKSFSGTSIAAAYISGLCTLLYETNPNLKFDDVIALLKVAASPIDNIPTNQQGEGLININEIIK